MNVSVGGVSGGCGFLVAQGGNFSLKLTFVSQQTGRCSELRGGRFRR